MRWHTNACYEHGYNCCVLSGSIIKSGVFGSESCLSRLLEVGVSNRELTLGNGAAYKQEEEEGNYRERHQPQIQTGVNSREIKREVMKWEFRNRQCSETYQRGKQSDSRISAKYQLSAAFRDLGAGVQALV